jgi:hypothetical protein
MVENTYLIMLHWADTWAPLLEVFATGVAVREKTRKLYALKSQNDESVIAGPVTPKFWETVQFTAPKLENVSLDISNGGYVVISFSGMLLADYHAFSIYCSTNDILWSYGSPYVPGGSEIPEEEWEHERTG